MADFKEASLMEGRLVRISKNKIELKILDEESNEPAIATLKLGAGVSVGVDVLGEDVKVIIVDGRVARITPVTGDSLSGSAKVGS